MSKRDNKRETMADMYTHQKKRQDFGKPFNFKDFRVLTGIGQIPDEGDKERGFISEEMHEKKNPNCIEISNFPELSVSSVNTKRVRTVSKKMFHFEGGWPADIEITDQNEKKKYLRKKVEKTSDNMDKFTPAVKKIIENLQGVINK
jgi:dynein intermediate chain 2